MSIETICTHINIFYKYTRIMCLTKYSEILLAYIHTYNF